MNSSRKASTNWLSAIGYRLSAIGYRLILGVLVSVLSFYAVAQSVGNVNKFSSTPGNPSCRFFDGFADNGNGTVTDPRNGLVWKRCAEGFVWSGSKCFGTEITSNWFDAMVVAKKSRFLGKNDWRLPTHSEIDSVVGRGGDWVDNLCSKNDHKKNSMQLVIN